MQNAFRKKKIIIVRTRGGLPYLPLYRDLVAEHGLIEKYMLFPRELPLEKTH